MRLYAGNGLKCENVRETAKCAIPHPPYVIFGSVTEHIYQEMPSICTQFHLTSYLLVMKRNGDHNVWLLAGFTLPALGSTNFQKIPFRE